MKSRRNVVVGTLASNSYAGMAWMPMQIAAGLCRVGLDDYYFETTSNWPYDPKRQAEVGDSDYALPYVARGAESPGLQMAAHRAAATRTASGSVCSEPSPGSAGACR